jgi:hypothetical protein
MRKDVDPDIGHQSSPMDFKCCTCKEQKPDGEAGTLSLVAKIGFFASALLLARGLSWPSKVCKDCADDTTRTGELGFGVSATIVVVGLLIFLGTKWHLVK